jgi:hypothetical protein
MACSIGARESISLNGLEEATIMFGSTTNSPLRPFGKKIDFISTIPLLIFLFAARLGAQTVATYGFEDGTADGWSSFNGASTPVATNAASHSGSFSLSCSPTITAPGNFPIGLGDIPTSGTASASFVVSVVGCNPNSQFTLSVPWSSAVYDAGTFVTTPDFNRRNGQ